MKKSPRRSGGEGTTQSLPCDNETLLPLKPAKPQRTTPRPKAKPPKFARDLAHLVRQRIAETGRSLAQVEERSGLNDGHLAHLLTPDSPTGRAGSIYTWDLILSATFTPNYRLVVIPDDSQLTLPSIETTDHHLKQIRHWRLSKYFRDMGARGGFATARRHGPEFTKERAQRAARARWANRKTEPKP